MTALKYSHNSNAKRLTKDAEQEALICVQNLSKWAEAIREIHTWPEYQPQPMHSLPNVAKQMQIKNLYFKDESKRFGTDLGSFKALGAPYAVFKLLQEEVFKQTGTRPTSTELRSGKYHEITDTVTVCVATDGNQGRGLAYGAKIFGCRCVDYIHGHVSEGRAKRMRDLGAIVIRIEGEYDDSVARAKEDARMNDWHFVSSTSWSDFDHGIPQDVMNAYMVVADEALNLVPAKEITHVFVCGGVGSIAAAIFLGYYTQIHGKGANGGSKGQNTPRFVVVEPEEADCLYQSSKSGETIDSQGNLKTIMAGLACRSPSPAAWKVLAWLGSDFIRVPDTFAKDGMKNLATGGGADIPVVCGESSAASMGVMLHSSRNEELRAQLGLTEESQVVLFGLEGATDPKIYEEIVGLSPAAVFEAQSQWHQN